MRDGGEIPLRDPLFRNRPRVLIVTPSKRPALTGNATTVERLQKHLRGESLVVTPLEVPRAVRDFSPDLIHFFHATKSFVPTGKPYLITLTGTDVHESQEKEPERFRKILMNSSAVTAISESLKSHVRVNIPVEVIPQGVDLPDSDIDIREWFSLRRKRFVLLPAGIRAVKDPLFAVREILPVQRELGIDLLILGEPYDEELAHRLKHPWVTIGQVPYEHMSAAYKQADLVLNTSRAEGQSNAVIEALSIRARILVADIRGNEIVPDPWRFPKREGELTKRLKTVFGKEPCIVPLPSADEEACSYMDVYRSVSVPG